MDGFMRKVVIIGPPDTFELVEILNTYTIAGYLSLQEEVRSVYSSYSYLGNDEQIPLLIDQGVSFVIALKSNKRRRDLMESIEKLNGKTLQIIHPDATVFSSAELGDGTVVAPQAVVSACARVGRGVVVNYGGLVGHDVELGDWSFVAPGAKLLGYAKIGRNVFLGTNCVVFPHVVIGDNVTIAANTTVTKNIPDNTTLISVDKKRYVQDL